MIALIKAPDGSVYPSVIFARYNDGWKSKIIAFTPDYGALTEIKYWNKSFFGGLERMVFETDLTETDFVINGKWRGFERIINDKALIKSIKRKKEIPAEVLQRCKELQSVVEIAEWNELTGQTEIDVLTNVSFGFHDGVIQKITSLRNGLRVEVKCWGCVIALDFINVAESHISEINWRDNCIIKSSVLFRDGKILWQVDDFNYYDDGEEYPECYIKAEKIFWKLKINR